MKCGKWTDQHDHDQHERETKTKIWVPDRNRTHDLSNTHWTTRTYGEQGYLTEFVCNTLRMTLIVMILASSLQNPCHIWTQLIDLALPELS